eukprot:CFRG7960T1
MLEESSETDDVGRRCIDVQTVSTGSTDSRTTAESEGPGCFSNSKNEERYYSLSLARDQSASAIANVAMVSNVGSDRSLLNNTSLTDISCGSSSALSSSCPITSISLGSDDGHRNEQDQSCVNLHGGPMGGSDVGSGSKSMLTKARKLFAVSMYPSENERTAASRSRSMMNQKRRVTPRQDSASTSELMGTPTELVSPRFLNTGTQETEKRNRVTIISPSSRNVKSKDDSKNRKLVTQISSFSKTRDSLKESFSSLTHRSQSSKPNDTHKDGLHLPGTYTNTNVVRNSSAFEKLRDQSVLDTALWRLCILDQLHRQQVMMLPFADFVKQNPNIPTKEIPESTGLKGNLLELQGRLKKYHKRHKRRMTVLWLMVVFLLLSLIGLGIYLGLYIHDDAKFDCLNTQFKIFNNTAYENFRNLECVSVKDLRFEFFTPESGTIDLPNLRTISGGLRILGIGSIASSVSVHLPNFESAGGVSVVKTFISDIYTPMCMNIDGEIEIDSNERLGALSFPNLQFVLSLELMNSRLSSISMPNATVMTSITMQYCDIGKIYLPKLRAIQTIRIDDVSGWDANKSINTAFTYGQGDGKIPTLPSGAVDIKCLMDKRCWNGTDSAYHVDLEMNATFPATLPPARDEDGNLIIHDGDRDRRKVSTHDRRSLITSCASTAPTKKYPRTENLSTPDRGQRDIQNVANDSILYLEFYMPVLNTIDSFTATRATNMLPLLLTKVYTIRELSFQLSSFTPGTKNGTVFMPHVGYISLFTLYQTGGLGSLHFPNLDSVDYLTVKFNAGLVDFVIGNTSATFSPNLFSKTSESGSIIGQSYSVEISQNIGLKHVALPYLQTSVQGVTISYNLDLLYLSLSSLMSSNIINIIQNTVMEGPLHMKHLIIGNLVITNNFALSGELLLPSLTNSIFINIAFCNFSAISLPLLKYMGFEEYEKLTDTGKTVLRLIAASSLGTRSSLIVKSTPIVRVSAPNLIGGMDIILTAVGKLLQIEVPKLKKLEGSLNISDSNFTMMEFPALEELTSLTIIANRRLETVVFPMLVKLQDLNVIGNPILTNLSLPVWSCGVANETCSSTVVMNDHLCLASTFSANMTSGQCILANQLNAHIILGNEASQNFMAKAGMNGTTAELLSSICPECCDQRLIAANLTTCRIANAADLNSLMFYY